MPAGLSFRTTAAAVLGYAVAMAYLEAAVVVYLTLAIGGRVGEIFPLRPAIEAGDLVAIEVGREAATVVMIAAAGLLAGRNGLERLAWAAVVFGAWDIGYYAWLNVFSGWPPALDTTDLLFLIPVPWVGPVWSPVAVSLALVVVGLVVARMIRSGRTVALSGRHWAAGLGGGLLVILSYTLDAGSVIDGGLPGPYPWPVFAAGMLLALVAAAHALRGARPTP
ncbi:MAG: hypothetical protein MUQ32_09640 [Chloroflexi bacterium]|nr:hypothetical protein [Chloroflexota bacterium]